MIVTVRRLALILGISYVALSAALADGRAKMPPPSMLQEYLQGGSVTRDDLWRAVVVPGLGASLGFISGGAASAPAATSFTASGFDTSGSSPITFTKSIGTASSDRYVVICMLIYAASGAPTVTVAGTSCALLTNVAASGNRFSIIYISSSPITSGTTANIVVNGTNTIETMGVYAITGLQSNVATATTGGAGTSGVVSLNIAVQAGGVVIGCAYSEGAPTTATASGISKDAQVDPGSGILTVFGHRDSPSAQSPLTASLSFDVSNPNCVGAAVALR